MLSQEAYKLPTEKKNIFLLKAERERENWIRNKKMKNLKCKIELKYVNRLKTFEMKFMLKERVENVATLLSRKF